MNLKFTFFFSLLLCSSWTFGQNYNWHETIGSGGINGAESLIKDSNGDYYLSGTFSETITFDNGAGGISLTSNGGQDNFLAKRNGATGLYDWAFGLGTNAEYEFISSIALDEFNNVILACAFWNTLDVDPSENVHEVTAVGNSDIGIFKYNSNGEFLWAYTVGHFGGDDPYGIAIDSNNDILVSGSYQFTPDFDAGEGEALAPTYGSYDAFLVSITNDGVFEWLVTSGGTGWDVFRDVEIDGGDNIYIGGYVADDFIITATNQEYPVIGTGTNGVLMKLSNTGSLNWSRTTDGNSASYIYDIHYKNNTLYATGLMDGTIDFDSSPMVTANYSGQYDAFVGSWSNLGDFISANVFQGTTDWDYGIVVTTDEYDNIYVGGSFFGTVNFGTISNTIELTSAYSDGFVVKMDNQLNVEWAFDFGGNSIDEPGSMLYDGDDNLLIAGVISGSSDIDPSENEVTVTTTANREIFLASYNIDLIPVVSNINELDKIVFNLYPNPTKGTVLLTATDADSNRSIEVTDIVGKTVLKQKFLGMQESIELNVPNGIYQVMIYSNETLEQAIKVVKQ